MPTQSQYQRLKMMIQETRETVQHAIDALEYASLPKHSNDRDVELAEAEAWLDAAISHIKAIRKANKT